MSDISPTIEVLCIEGPNDGQRMQILAIHNRFAVMETNGAVVEYWVYDLFGVHFAACHHTIDSPEKLMHRLAMHYQKTKRVDSKNSA